MQFETLKRINDLEERCAALEKRLAELEARLPQNDVHEAVDLLASNPKTRPILRLRKNRDA